MGISQAKIYIKNCYHHCSQTLDKAKIGVLSNGSRVSQLAADFYSMSGFLCVTRAALASMHVLSLIPALKGHFTLAILEFDRLKTLYYATMWMDSLPKFFSFDSQQHVHFHLPKKENGQKDYVKLLYSIGGVCGTVTYLQRMNVITLPILAKLSTIIGQTKLFSFKGVRYTINHVPVLCSIPANTSEFFFFLASSGEVIRWIKGVYNATDQKIRKKSFELLPLLRLTTSLGRCIGLGLHRQCRQSPKASLVLLSINFIGQWSALFAMAIDKDRQRMRRLQGLS